MSIDSAKAEVVTRAAQGVLTNANKSLVVDGYWGTFTNDAYRSAPATVKQAVDMILAAFGTTSAELYKRSRPTTASGVKNPANLVTLDKVNGWLTRAVAMTGAESVGITAGKLKGIVWLESAKRLVDGKWYFDVNSQNSLGYSGLYQFSRKTWNDVIDRSVSGPKLPPFEKAAFDGWYNTLAMVKYAILNVAALLRLGYSGPVTAQVVYGAHQQGARGYLSYVRTGVPIGKQSEESLAFIDTGRLNSTYMV